MTTVDERRAEILAEIAAMIREVIGEEWAAETPIGMDTTFVRNLEIESIELVALSEKIQARFGDAVDFPTWLSGMDLDQIIGLTVGQLVDYIAGCPSKT